MTPLLACGKLVLVWLATAPPCASAPADLTSEQGLAGVYVEIAAEEERAGRKDAAETALREALRRDPSLAPARQGLARLCRERQGFDALVEEVRAGRCDDVLASEVTDAPSELLAGLCRFERSEDAQADAHFARAAAAPELHDVAVFYRGLIARRNGRNDEAQGWFETAGRSNDPRLSRAARELSSDVRREKGVSMLLLLDAGRDSNVALLPDGTPTTGSTADDFAGAAALFSVFPGGPQRPGFQAVMQLRKQRRDSRYDLGVVSLSALWQPRLGDWQPRLQLSQELLALGFQFYLWEHQARLALRRYLGQAFVELAYAPGYEDYRPEALDGYSGVHHGGALVGRLPPLGDLLVTLRYAVDLQQAKVGAVSYLEHGPTLALRWTPLTRLSFEAEAGGAWRGYDAPAEGSTTLRRQRFVDLALQTEWSVTRELSLLGSMSGRDASSAEPLDNYRRWVFSMGLGYAATP